MVEQTFIIIKPDATKRGLIGEIISRFERKGFYIAAMTLRHQDESWCNEHYKGLDKHILSRVIPAMSFKPLIGIILCGEDAIRVVREMIGCTNSLDAKPGTIRGDYGGAPVHENLVHAADSLESAVRESQLFWREQ